MSHIHIFAPARAWNPLRLLAWEPRRKRTHLQVSEEPAVVLQDGVHAVRHGHRVLPVVVWDPPVVLLHGHDKTTQLFKLKAVWKEIVTETGSQYTLRGLWFGHTCPHSMYHSLAPTWPPGALEPHSLLPSDSLASSGRRLSNSFCSNYQLAHQGAGTRRACGSPSLTPILLLTWRAFPTSHRAHRQHNTIWCRVFWTISSQKACSDSQTTNVYHMFLDEWLSFQMNPNDMVLKLLVQMTLSQHSTWQKWHFRYTIWLSYFILFYISIMYLYLFKGLSTFSMDFKAAENKSTSTLNRALSNIKEMRVQKMSRNM